VQDGGIDSDAPGGLPALSGGGALGNGRMHRIPQMLECYRTSFPPARTARAATLSGWSGSRGR
jgi:hypothetical protein